MEALTLGDTRSDAHALVDTLADSLAEVEVMRLGDIRGNKAALVSNWVTRLQRWRR